jgi:hypothetical protein
MSAGAPAPALSEVLSEHNPSSNVQSVLSLRLYDLRQLSSHRNFGNGSDLMPYPRAGAHPSGALAHLAQHAAAARGAYRQHRAGAARRHHILDCPTLPPSNQAYYLATNRPTDQLGDCAALITSSRDHHAWKGRCQSGFILEEGRGFQAFLRLWSLAGGGGRSCLRALLLPDDGRLLS